MLKSIQRTRKLNTTLAAFSGSTLLWLASTATAQTLPDLPPLEPLPPVPEAVVPDLTTQSTQTQSTQTQSTQTPVVPDEPLSGVTPPNVANQDTIPGSTASAGLADARHEAAEQVEALGLVDAIATALRNNPQRDAAISALEAAEARIGVARSAGGLQVGLNGSANYQRSFGGSSRGGGGVIVIPPEGEDGIDDGTGTVIPTGGGDSNSSNFTKTLGLDARYPIYDGGRAKGSRRAAQASARALAAQTLLIEQTLVQNTITAYLNVLRTGQLLEVAESDLAVSRERRRVAGVRFDAGAAARLEVLTANTQLAQAQQRRITASNDWAQAKSILNILMGRAPETPVRVEPVAALTPQIPLPTGVLPSGEAPVPESPTGVLPVGASSEDLRDIAAAANPALAINRFQIEAAEANIDVAKAARKPSFDLSLTGLLRDPVTTAGRFLLSLGLGVAQTLFDSGRARSEITEARALTEQARSNLDTQSLNVASEIEQSLLTLDSSQQRLTSADAAIIEAIEALRAAQLGYEAGVQTNLDVSDAQSRLLLAQTEAANARFDVANAQAQLSASVGVLTVEGQAAYEQALQEQTTAEEQRLAAVNRR